MGCTQQIRQKNSTCYHPLLPLHNLLNLSSYILQKELTIATIYDQKRIETQMWNLQLLKEISSHAFELKAMISQVRLLDIQQFFKAPFEDILGFTAIDHQCNSQMIAVQNYYGAMGKQNEANFNKIRMSHHVTYLQVELQLKEKLEYEQNEHEKPTLDNENKSNPEMLREIQSLKSPIPYEIKSQINMLYQQAFNAKMSQPGHIDSFKLQEYKKKLLKKYDLLMKINYDQNVGCTC